MKKTIYNIVFFTGCGFMLLLYSFYNQLCVSRFHEQFDASSHHAMVDTLTFFFGYLLIVFFIYTIDIIMLLVSLFKNKEVNTLEFYNYLGAIVGFFVFWNLMDLYSSNGECDLILSPYDTGANFIITCCVLVTFWKRRLIKKKSV